jgi:hypothetical protein
LTSRYIISIVAFNLFECEEFRSEFQLLEVARHTPLTDRMSMVYFELKKIPEAIDPDDELLLWLALFRAGTEEELKQIEELGVPIMQEAVRAFRGVSASPEFRERERLRIRASHDEASALRHAAEQATEVERKKWQGVIAEKDAAHAAENAAHAAENALLRAQLEKQNDK